jgi:flagellar operon protein
VNSLAGALSRLIPAQNDAALKTSEAAGPGAVGIGFKDALKEKMDASSAKLQFSKHASARLSDRHIDLSEQDIERLSRATDKAAEKGAKDALMMLGNLNLIVSVNNRTVVTAMQAGDVGDAVYTNIDTAVVVGDELI